ncbi:MAG: phage baseplate assembly protein V [Gammaproteobacteria bacterium]|nr:phage baseplate assembly protein V [Gammaproteobacteria bacterium]
MSIEARLEELERRLANVLRVGTVTEVDAPAARCRVAIAGEPTAPRPWLTHRAGDAVTWWAPSVGEQVLVLAPQGDLGQAVVLPALYSDATAAPSEQTGEHRTVYPDGAVIRYDSAAHALTADLPGSASINAAGPVDVTAGADVTVTAPRVVLDAETVRCTGDLDVVGEITDHVDTEPHTLSGMRAIYDDHTHAELGIGGQTSIPDELMGGGA